MTQFHISKCLFYTIRLQTVAKQGIFFRGEGAASTIIYDYFMICSCVRFEKFKSFGVGGVLHPLPTRLRPWLQVRHHALIENLPGRLQALISLGFFIGNNGSCEADADFKDLSSDFSLRKFAYSSSSSLLGLSRDLWSFVSGASFRPAWSLKTPQIPVRSSRHTERKYDLLLNHSRTMTTYPSIYDVTQVRRLSCVHWANVRFLPKAYTCTRDL